MIGYVKRHWFVFQFVCAVSLGFSTTVFITKTIEIATKIVH